MAFLWYSFTYSWNSLCEFISSTKEQTSKSEKLEKENNELIKYSNPVTIKNIKFNSSSDKKTYFTGLDNNLQKNNVIL